MPTRYLYASQGLIATTQGLNDFMACGRSDSAIIQADILDTIQPEVSTLAQRLNDTMDKYYNNELSKKGMMQIKR